MRNVRSFWKAEQVALLSQTGPDPVDISVCVCVENAKQMGKPLVQTQLYRGDVNPLWGQQVQKKENGGVEGGYKPLEEKLLSLWQADMQ